jgi:AraC-like DNA-binding protein
VLQHTVSGSGNLLHERRRYRLRAGDTMLVIVPHNHRYWLAPGDCWEYFWISMSGQEAVRVHRIIQATTGPVFRLRPEAVEQVASCCLRLIEGEGETPGVASAIAYEAAAAVYDAVFGSQGASAHEGERAGIGRVVDFIRDNLAESLGVGRLAEIAGFSRAHFSRAFAASEGTPPAEYVLQARMRHAARLLTGHALLPVKEIALLCGFDDPNYFAKVFRRFFGTSPTEFRTTGMYSAVGAENPARPDRSGDRQPQGRPQP